MAASARIDELRRKFEESPRRYFAPLANEYRKAGDLETAIRICRGELASYPEHISGHIVLGQALYEAGRRAEARDVFEASLDLDPENLIALRHLGDIARADGDDGAARHWYQRILEADPRNDDIAAQLASLGRAAAHPAPEPAPGPAARFAPPPDAAFANEPAPWLAPPTEDLGGPAADAPPAVDAADDDLLDTPFVDGWDLQPFAMPPAAPASGPTDEPSVLDAGELLEDFDDTPPWHLAPGEPAPVDPAARSPEPVLDPVVGLDLAPLTDAAQVQLAAADLGGAPLPAADRWAEELAAADESLSEGAAFGGSATEPDGDGGRADAVADVVEPERMILEHGPGAPVEVAFEAPDVAAAATDAGPPPAPAADDARADAASLAALTSGAFATETLADLFVQQGHLEQAAAIYGRLVAERPGDRSLSGRLDAVLALLAGHPEARPDHVAEAGEAAATATASPSPAEAPGTAGPGAERDAPPTAAAFFAALAARQGAGAEVAAGSPDAGAAGPRGFPEPEPPAVAAADAVIWGEPWADADPEPPADDGAAGAAVLAPAAVDPYDEQAASTLAAAFAGGAEAAGRTSTLLDELAAVPDRDPASAPEDLSFDRFFAGFEDLLRRPSAPADAGDRYPAPDGSADVPTGPTAAPDPEGPGGTAAATGDATAATTATTSAAATEDDLAQFNAWLRGLGEL